MGSCDMGRVVLSCLLMLALLPNCVEGGALPPGTFWFRCQLHVTCFCFVRASRVESMPAHHGSSMNSCVFYSWTVRRHCGAFRFPNKLETSRRRQERNRASFGCHHEARAEQSASCRYRVCQCETAHAEH